MAENHRSQRGSARWCQSPSRTASFTENAYRAAWRFRPGGAPVCSHGWSEPRRSPASGTRGRRRAKISPPRRGGGGVRPLHAQDERKRAPGLRPSPSPHPGRVESKSARIHGFRDAKHRSTRGYPPEPLRGQIQQLRARAISLDYRRTAHSDSLISLKPVRLGQIDRERHRRPRRDFDDLRPVVVHILARQHPRVHRLNRQLRRPFSRGSLLSVVENHTRGPRCR